ncbi:MAG: serine--tRNA ligase [Clostridia bacterium]|nr:serine--tRNA ligase [Clostridia bacterium]
MLDIKRIRNDFHNVKELIEKRTKGDFEIGKILELDEDRRKVIARVEEMKNRQKIVSKEVPKLKKEGKDATAVLSEMKELSEQIKDLDSRLREIDEEIKQALLGIPNAPRHDTPVGNSDEDNELVKTWGEPTKFQFEKKAHWDVGIDLGILDFERASKITGSRFTVYRGLGAKLERALINFMLDIHTCDHGYEEILPPFIVNRDSMTGTGQLPKFEDDMFHLPSKDYFLIPTAEVPLTNLYMNEILDGDKLPIYHTAFTPCFRKEAGSAGRDTRGLIRQHQFNKVELVKFTRPEDSYNELEKLLKEAEEILKRLELPHRVVRLCGGDLGFASAMTYDIEVWMPSYDRYLEISSCSNFEDYQARRANIRFRPEPKGKAQFVHTLNGSGLAVGRTLSAILENYQQADGSVVIPKALRPYMGGLEKITK